MNRHARDELMKYVPIADAIAQAFGEDCEVVLHDLTTPLSSVIYTVNGHVTGREVGQSFHHIITRVLLSKKLQNDVVANYKTETEDQRIIKSTTVLLRNTKGDVNGALCINQDLHSLRQLQEYLNKLTRVEEEPLKDEVELLGNVQEIANNIIQQIIGENNVEKMDKAKKLEIVRFMDEKGVFLIRGAIDKVAESLQISRVTVYSYLDQIRNKTEEINIDTAN
jgi:predicted transcriptional regulator YheO